MSAVKDGATVSAEQVEARLSNLSEGLAGLRVPCGCDELTIGDMRISVELVGPTSDDAHDCAVRFKRTDGRGLAMRVAGLAGSPECGGAHCELINPVMLELGSVDIGYDVVQLAAAFRAAADIIEGRVNAALGGG
jgi:hypothetical protein